MQFDHKFKTFPIEHTQAGALARLMDVEVQDAWRVDVTRFPVFVEDVQRLSPNFENSYDDAAENRKKNCSLRRFFFSYQGK